MNGPMCTGGRDKYKYVDKRIESLVVGRKKKVKKEDGVTTSGKILELLARKKKR